MSTWNYRVIEEDGVFVIHEVYYDDAGQPEYFTAEPVHPMGETLEELRGDLAYFQRALDLPVLKIEELQRQISNTARIKNESRDA